MDALVENSVISTQVFSLCMKGYKGDTSGIDFGVPQIANMKNNTTIGI
jgi:hypothetical protein